MAIADMATERGALKGNGRQSMDEMAREAVERSCREQGIPVYVTDPEVLDRVIVLAGLTPDQIKTRRVEPVVPTPTRAH